MLQFMTQLPVTLVFIGNQESTSSRELRFKKKLPQELCDSLRRRREKIYTLGLQALNPHGPGRKGGK
jgi:hypothetical protein